MAINGSGGDPQDDGALLPEARCHHHHSRWLAERRCSTEDVHTQVQPTLFPRKRQTSSRVSKSLLRTPHAPSEVDVVPCGQGIKCKISSRRSMYRNSWSSPWIIRTTLVTAMILFFFATTSASYRCQSIFENSLAEIVPRKDMEQLIDVPIKVACHYDHEKLGNQTVQFRKTHNGKLAVIPSVQVNESTISAVLRHNTTEDYMLFCYAPQYNGKKSLCFRRVSVGYPPLNILNFRCRSPNRETLDCFWNRPQNSVPTNYSFSCTVPFFRPHSMDITMVSRNNFTYDFKQFVGTRTDIKIIVTGNNSLGVANFTYSLNILAVVVPPAPRLLNAESIGTDFVHIEWDLSFQMDSFPGQLIQEVSYSTPPENTWVTAMGNAKYMTVGEDPKRIYFENLTLPYAGVLYEVRVRMNQAEGGIQDDYWSEPSYINVTTVSLPPDRLPLTSPCGFEVRDSLLFRDLYVYWQQIDRLHHNGPALHYSVMAYDTNTSQPVLAMPVLSNLTYAKFINFEVSVNYRFEITVVNDLGAGPNTTAVTVPRRSQLLPMPAMFTVIKYNDPAAPRAPIYRLLWKAPERLPEESHNDLRYVLFWCPRNPYSPRCEKNLAWESAGDDLNSLRLRDEFTSLGVGSSRVVIYERNLTGLGEDILVGIAAIQKSSNVSSGIKWATCSVIHDDSPPAPNPPVADILTSSTVKLLWKFECKDKSAVPFAVNISYCEITTDDAIFDFSDCTSPVEFQQSELSGPALISGLRPSSTIIFAISLVTIVGESKPSLAIKVPLPEDVPGGPPSSLNITAITNSTVSLEWAAPEPHLANGIITSYEISTQPSTPAMMYNVRTAQKNMLTLAGLAPYTQYVVSVAACTVIGCAVRHPATAPLTTDPGVPAEVNMFSVNSLNGHISWAFDQESCHSKNCSFDLEIQYNDTLIKQHRLTQNSISLKDINVTCHKSKTLTVSLRAVGVGLDGSPIYGPWNTVERSCSLTGSDCSDSDSSTRTQHNVNVYVTNVFGTRVPLGLAELVALIRGSVSSGALQHEVRQQNGTRQSGVEEQPLQGQGMGPDALVNLSDLIAVLRQNEVENSKRVGNKGNVTETESHMNRSNLDSPLSKSTNVPATEYVQPNSSADSVPGSMHSNNLGYDVDVNRGDDIGNFTDRDAVKHFSVGNLENSFSSVAAKTVRTSLHAGDVHDDVPGIFSNKNVFVNIKQGKNFNRSDVNVLGNDDGGNDFDSSANRSSNWSHPSGLMNRIAGQLVVPVSMSKSVKADNNVPVPSSKPSIEGSSLARTPIGSIGGSSKSVSSEPFQPQVVSRTDEDIKAFKQLEDTALTANQSPLQVSHSTLHFNKTRFTHKPVNKYNASNVFNMNFDQLSVFNINGTSVVDLSLNGRKTSIANHSGDSSSASDDDTVPEISPASAYQENVDESDSSVQNIVYLVNYGTINILQNNAAEATEALGKRNSGKSLSETFGDSFSNSPTKFEESSENVFDESRHSRPRAPPPGSSELFGLLSGGVSVRDELPFASGSPMIPSSTSLGGLATSRGPSSSARTRSAQPRDLSNNLREHTSRPSNQWPIPHSSPPPTNPVPDRQSYMRSRTDKKNSFSTGMPNPTVLGEVLEDISSNTNVDQFHSRLGKLTSNDDVESSFSDSFSSNTRRTVSPSTAVQRRRPFRRIGAAGRSRERPGTSDRTLVIEGDVPTDDGGDILRDDFLRYVEPSSGAATGTAARIEPNRARHSNEKHVLPEYEQSKSSINYSSPYSVTNYSERSSVQTNIDGQ